MAAKKKSPAKPAKTGKAAPRARKRVALARLAPALLGLCSGWTGRALALALCAAACYALVLHGSAFRIGPGQEGLRILGASDQTRAAVEQVFAPDIGGGLLAVDLEERLLQLQAIAWVRSARVKRTWPNALSVLVVEREPVALLLLSSPQRERLIDAEGVILNLRPVRDRSLPVLTGIDESMPMEDRRPRMALFADVMEAFRTAGADLDQEVSEVDLTDPRNAVVVARHDGSSVTLQMGDRHLAHRVNIFLENIDTWRTDYGPIQGVDLQYEGNVPIQPVRKDG